MRKRRKNIRKRKRRFRKRRKKVRTKRKKIKRKMSRLKRVKRSKLEAVDNRHLVGLKARLFSLKVCNIHHIIPFSLREQKATNV